MNAMVFHCWCAAGQVRQGQVDIADGKDGTADVACDESSAHSRYTRERGPCIMAVELCSHRFVALYHELLPSVLWCCWLGGRKGIRPVKNWVVGCWRGYICLEWDADLRMMPLPVTVSCFSKIQIGFTVLVPADPGSPGQRAVKRVCVCVCVYLAWQLHVQAVTLLSFGAKSEKST